MNPNRLLFSIGVALFVLCVSLQIERRIVSHKPLFHVSSGIVNESKRVISGTMLKSVLHVLDFKEFSKSSEFEKMPFSERNRLALDYLFQESKKTYDCVIQGNDTRKCFSFKEDVIYTKKIYNEEDMVMKYPHQYNLVINNPHACDSDPQIVIGSPVGPRQFLERMGTRHSWGSVTNVNGIRVKHLFFAGQDENDPEGDRMLREENDYYHDIIQFDMKNHFMNLTLLAILTYNWTDFYCPNIQYYVRSDNDMWFNPYTMISSFLNVPRKNALMGNKIVHGKPIRVSVSRYYLSKNVFPEEEFSPYMSGCFLAMSRDVLPIIVKRCVDIGPIIYFDDVFLGQIAKIANISLVPFPWYKVEYYPKAYSGSVYSKLWAVHRYTPVDNMALWQLANL